MKRNSVWINSIILYTIICIVLASNIFFIRVVNIWTIFCFIYFIIFAFKLQDIINHGPAYYVTYIIPKKDMEQRVYNNLIVLSDGEGTANVFSDNVKEIAELPSVNVNLYFTRQKQQHSWVFDPYTSLTEMRKGQR